ncbi:MAG: hypothetical protein M3Q99_09480 [Acidobacteriota bacterium]|nr:hypothetical protein [Acidobacteriota bacterium]
MSKKLFLNTFAAIIALAAMTAIVSAQKVKDTPVTSTIENADSTFQPFRIQNDNLGSYINGTNSVVSRIQSIGDWELNMLSSPARRTFVDFGDPVNPLDPANGAPSSAYYPVRFLAQCPADLRNLTAGASQSCKMVIAVNVGADRYSIRFGYVSGTGQPLWTCNTAASGKCGSWRMASDPSGAGKIAAQLYKITTSRGKETATPIGKYYFSFGVNVANQ